MDWLSRLMRTFLAFLVFFLVVSSTQLVSSIPELFAWDDSGGESGTPRTGAQSSDPRGTGPTTPLIADADGGQGDPDSPANDDAPGSADGSTTTLAGSANGSATTTTTPAQRTSPTATATTTTTTTPVAPGPVTVNPTRIDGYLANPGMGWQEKISTTDPRFPYTVEYPIRATIAWNVLNPAPGVFDWTALDGAISAATARGRKTSFRIYTMQDADSPKVPAWVLEAGAHLVNGNEVDYSDAVYQEHWSKFVEALRVRYDGDPRIAWIDISGYGAYNEWNWTQQTEIGSDYMAPTTIDGTTRKRLADLFIGGSGTALVTHGGDDSDVSEVQYSYPGFRTTQLLMPYAGIRNSTWYVMAARPDVGFRFDCLGRETLENFRSRLGENVLQTWRRAPVVFEFCSHDVSMDRARALAAGMGASVIRDNRQSSNPGLESVVQLAGYRYVLDSLATTSSVRRGGSLDVRMEWSNIGSARAYRSLGQDFVLRVALLSSDRSVAHLWSLDDPVMSWLPGTTESVRTSLAIPDGLSAGRYTLAVSIHDRGSGRNLNLGISGRNPWGWYPMTVIDVRD